MVTPAARREAVAHLCSVHGVSQRRACRTIGAERTSIRYRHRRVDDGAMRSRLRELAAVRRRFGWRRLHVLLSREGVRVNHKKLRRLYNGCRFAGVADASGPWAPGRRWCCRRSEPTLVTRLRQRHADRRQAVPHPGDGRRLYPGVPLPGG